jgi:hypothetical protein
LNDIRNISANLKKVSYHGCHDADNGGINRHRAELQYRSGLHVFWTFVLFIGGTKLLHFSPFIGLFGIGSIYVILHSPYKLRRILTFLEPEKDLQGRLSDSSINDNPGKRRVLRARSGRQY